MRDPTYVTATTVQRETEKNHDAIDIARRGYNDVGDPTPPGADHQSNHTAV